MSALRFPRLRFPIFTGFLFLVVLALWSCDPDDDQPLEPGPTGPSLQIFFDPYFEGVPLDIIERKVNVYGSSFEVWNMKFYLSNIQLHGTDSSITLSDIELLDIRTDNNVLGFDLPPGNFTGISFDLGVPQHLNGTANPDFLVSVYSPTHPLSESNGMYWVWQTGYRFMSFEGRYDSLQSDADFLPSSFALHSGRDTLFRSTVEFARDINIVSGITKELNFAIEVDRIFLNDTDSIDIRIDNQFHGSFEQLDLGIKFADNTVAAFRLLP